VRSFAPAERFVTEVKSHKLRPAYVFAGDEAFFRKRCREAILQHLVPADRREFSLYEVDLGETEITEVLDRARTPSLMAPFQVFFVRGVKKLYGRGSHQDEFKAIEEYCANPNPDAVLIFIADHLSIPADARRMDMTDRDRYERLRETLGQYCGIVELARVEEGEAVRWVVDTGAAQGVKVETDAARELVDALGGDLMLIANELEKLVLYVGEKKRITLGDVETMVLAAKQRSLYELTDAISAKDRACSLFDHEELSMIVQQRRQRQIIVRLEKAAVDDGKIEPLGRQYLRRLQRRAHHGPHSQNRHLASLPQHLPRPVRNG
jgi:DNA polymerase-3 subunit delta